MPLVQITCKKLSLSQLEYHVHWKGVAYLGETRLMRTAAVIVVAIFAQMFATGQKRTGSGVHKSVSSSQSMPKSVSSEAVAAALRTNSSSSANELSKIEHENVKPQSRPAAQKSVSQNAAPDLGKNKPMKFSHKPPRKP